MSQERNESSLRKMDDGDLTYGSNVVPRLKVTRI
jgi:hypothetical protein